MLSFSSSSSYPTLSSHPQNFPKSLLFIIFNRKETAERVFERIQERRPKYLYVAADGPRPNVPSDQEKCAEVRALIRQVDWPCEVKTLFREENLGCRNNVCQCISWFFNQVEEGIILEDDCLPDPTFFTYCAELLERYRHDTRIMHIGGANFQQGIKRGNASYYFSQLPHIWGWASWRRAWKYYDVNVSSFPDVMMKQKAKIFHEQELWYTFYWVFHQVHFTNFSTWDAQWTYTVNVQHGLSILPNDNLISNIGVSLSGTHGFPKGYPYSAVPTVPMQFPMSHPTLMYPDAEADWYSTRHEFPQRWWPRKMAGRLYHKILDRIFAKQK